MKKHIIISATIVLLYSCIKEVSIAEIPFEKKLVIGCIANPDSTFRVNIRSSQLINDTTLGTVENASVLLFKEGIYIDSMHYEQQGWYRSSVFPVAGSEYELKVFHPEFVNVATAKTMIPSSPEINNATYTLNLIDPSHLFPSNTILVSFNDPVESNDFYEPLFFFQYLLDGTISSQGPPYVTNTQDPSILSDSNLDYAPSTVYFSDDLFNGTIKNMTFGEGDPYSSDSVYAPEYNIFFALRKISPSYYHYLRTWTVHRFNQNSTFNTSEPLTLLFQGDPVELYSNVENGYGIFGAYNTSTMQAQFVP